MDAILQRPGKIERSSGLQGWTGAVLGLLAGGLLGSFTALFVLFLRARVPHLPDAGCALPVFKSIPDFGLVTQDEDRYSTAVDVARLRTFSFYVHNLGPHPVLVQPEMSPDGFSWSPFGEMLYELGAGEKQLLVPQYFLRFARIRFRSARPGSPSMLNVWFQGQS